MNPSKLAYADTSDKENEIAIDALEFLQLVLPSSGGYYLVLIQNGRTVHRFFDSLPQLLTTAIHMDQRADVSIYFALSTYAKDHVIVDGKKKWRTPENRLEVQSFWLDIDCGEEKAATAKGYPTKHDATAALKDFCNTVGLQFPTIIDSGNGLHAYWALTEPISANDWQPIAIRLKELTKQLGLLADDSRTSDSASILRIPSTHNKKNEPKLVHIIERQKVRITPSAFDVKIINSLGKNVGTSTFLDQAIPDYLKQPIEGSIFGELREFRPSDGNKVADNCQQIAAFRETGVVPYPVWFAAIGVLKHCVDGERIAHEWSAKFEGYSRSETQTKLDTYSTAPTTCDKFRLDNPVGCQNCRHAGKIKSPITLGLTQRTSETIVRDFMRGGRLSLSTKLPPPRDYVILDMVMGNAYVMAGFGGSGETQLAIQIVLVVGTGSKLYQRSQNVKLGSALMVLGEECQSEIDRRVNGSIQALDLRSQSETIAKNIRIIPAVGEDIRLAIDTRDGTNESGMAESIIEASKRLAIESGEPVRLIVLDHLGLLHGGEHNAREDAAITMRIANKIAQITGAAVMLLAHSPKGSRNKEESDASDIAGSSAFVDQSRGAFVLATMRETEAKSFGISQDERHRYSSLVTVKNNYGPSGIVDWLTRQTAEGYGVSVLVPAELTKPIKNRANATNLAAKIVEVVREHRGEYSKTKLRDYHSGKNSTFGASKSEVERVTAELLQNGQLKLRSPSPDECKKFGFSQQVRQVLDLPSD